MEDAGKEGGEVRGEEDSAEARAVKADAKDQRGEKKVEDKEGEAAKGGAKTEATSMNGSERERGVEKDKASKDEEEKKRKVDEDTDMDGPEAKVSPLPPFLCQEFSVLESLFARRRVLPLCASEPGAGWG